MATQVQRRRGNTAQNNAFLGALGELAFNTELIGLRLHDGITVGGHPIAMLSDVLTRVAKSGDTMTGALLLPNGTTAAPALSFSGDSTTGVFRSGNSIVFSIQGSISHAFATGVFDIRSDAGVLRFGNAAQDTILTRDAANTLALRNGVNAQTFNVYNTFTDTSNFERGQMQWAVNILSIGTDNLGTGTFRGLRVYGSTIAFFTHASTRASAVSRWSLDGSGHFLASTDNVYDIGASGATRPRTGYFGTSLFVGATKVIGAQGAAVADAAGGATVDAEARTAINTLLARLRTHGLIAT